MTSAIAESTTEQVEKDLMECLSDAVRDLTPKQVIPGRDRIWVKRVPAFEETAGGLKLPDSAQRQQNVCLVLAVGPGVDDVSVDDVVVLESFSGDAVGFLDDYVMISANFVMAKLNV